MSHVLVTRAGAGAALRTPARLAVALAADLLLLAAPLGAPRHAAAETVGFTTRVTDNNRVGLTTTNYAFYGNNFQSRAPSFEFPLGSGYEHMVRAGIWFGALGITDTGEILRVSTGAFDASTSNSGPASTEFIPTSVVTERSKLPNSRFYSPEAISEQDFVCTFTDDPGRKAPLSSENHLPLGIEVRQEFYNWSFAAFSDLVICHLTFRGTRSLLRQVYVGMFSELASGPKNLYSTWPPSSSSGGSLGGWFSKKLLQWDAGRRLIAEHYCQDVTNCHAEIVPPWVGIKLLGVRPDTILTKQVGLQLWNYAPGDTARDEDRERYTLLSSPWQCSPDSLPPMAAINDPVELLTVGPFTMNPESEFNDTTSLSVDFAFCGGDTWDELLNAADFAQLAFDFRYVVPTPPPSPHLRVVASENALELFWDKSPESASDPTSPQPGGLDFEGYRVYAGSDREGLRRVAQFDVPDTAGFNTGFADIQLEEPRIFDGDTMYYHYRIAGLRDGFKEFVAVTSYDTGDQQILSLESGISQNKTEAIPGVAPGERPGSGVTVFPNPYKVEAAWDQGTLVRDHYLWFGNLPARCQLSIFTLSGDLVFETDFDGSTYQGEGARGVYDATRELDVPAPTLSGASYAWNLISREGQAVASGLYLFSVKDLGTGDVQRGKFLVVKSDREGY
jgi:hypothetical protein